MSSVPPRPALDYAAARHAWAALGDYLIAPPVALPMDGSPKLALRPAEAAEALGLSRAELYRHIQSGELVSFKVGKARLIAVDDLRAFIAARRVS
jgi:excisionase family DNA binding protein